MTENILIIDDEADIRNVLADIFEDEGYSVLKAAHSEQALALISSNKIDLIVLDIWLDNSDMDGMQILKHLKGNANYDAIPILMISGHGNVEMAVNAMKIGAFDFIEKPFKIEHILLTVNRALEQKLLKDENKRLRDIATNTGIIKHAYKSPAMIDLMKHIQNDAESDARVLLIGEKGTGKSRIARIIHDVSKRSKFPIAYLNSYHFSIKTIESELSQNPNGTLVLENIEVLSTTEQNELLSFLSKSMHTTRIISTASSTLSDLINTKKFSSALYDRVSILHYTVPAIKNRVDDIDILIHEFIDSICAEYNIAKPILAQDIWNSLKSNPWEGNVRQLKMAVEWIIMCYLINPKNQIAKQDVQFWHDNIDYSNHNVIEYSRTDKNILDELIEIPLKQAREQFEKLYLAKILQKCDGNIVKMADYIDMERTALYRKLKSLNIPTDMAKAGSA
jgi:two-component system, NtrC family, nitrogen regulation response regulator NtrX